MTETIKPMPTRTDQQQLVEELVDKTRAEGITSPALEACSRPTKTVLKTALEVELSEAPGRQARSCRP